MEDFDALEIKHYKTRETIRVDAFWLRDHCRCKNCYNIITKQRKYNVLDIPENIMPIETQYSQNGKLFEVKWNDGHHAVYDVDFLFAVQFEKLISNVKGLNLKTPWNEMIILQTERNLRFSLPHLIASDDAVKSVLGALIRYGIVLIDDVPPTTSMTEAAIRRIFPIMRTFFGEMYTFSDQADHADTAYTKEFLGLHTDNTYFCDAAGLQALHCLEHIGGDGGENFFVDGLNAVTELKRHHLRAFEVLTKTHVTAEYIEDGQNHKHSAPIIRIDPITGEFIQLRLNIYDRAPFDTLPQQEMREFYKCFRQFLGIINDLKNRWTFKLKPGTIVIFDNWRICHARHAYTGARTMTGCYVQRSDYLSKARLEGVID